MTDWDLAAPRASALVESLRAFGYTPETAIADLVDNSISAEATLIEVTFNWDGSKSSVLIVDNGRGMSTTELVNAMRPGSTSPLVSRSLRDLGRFGLGLKTASFSQARELTVSTMTKSGSRKIVRRWDLDLIAQTDEWRLQKTEPLHHPIAKTESHGTVVQWTKCDRLVGENVPNSDVRAQRQFQKTIEKVHQHLSAVFSKFLSGKNRVEININRRSVRPWDPFLQLNLATQSLGEETLYCRSTPVIIKPYILPHRSKLSENEQEATAGMAGWNAQQGFYVYRSDRLLIQGDWLGLGFSKDEHTKLARIAIEFPSSLDDLWQVDVRKSTARVPGPLQDDLRRIAKATRRRAEEVYRFRGKIAQPRNGDKVVTAWSQIVDRNGVTRFKINRDHPVIRDYTSKTDVSLKAFERIIRFLEETIPTTLIGMSISQQLDKQAKPYAQNEAELRLMLRLLVSDLLEGGMSRDEIFAKIAIAEPFVNYPELIHSEQVGRG